MSHKRHQGALPNQPHHAINHHMTSVDLAPIASTQPIERTKPGKVTGRLRKAIDAMVWLGLPRAKAAQHAGLAEHSLYQALRRPPVKAHYLAELEILRTSERARNFHALCEVRDQTGNQVARVNAVNALERLPEGDQAARGAVSFPGFVIVLGVGQAPQAVTIEHSKLDQLQDDKQDQ